MDIHIWNLFAWEWMGWSEQFVKREIENRRFSLLSRAKRWWTWPLVTTLFRKLSPERWKKLESGIARENAKRQCVVNWGRIVGWSMVNWRAGEILMGSRVDFDDKFFWDDGKGVD
ncbi:hypothetical protein E8E11_008449 [Didymella keratinophila]|nr:hypothetical protein E8E11_008449 [Didymella keratinophila]